MNIEEPVYGELVFLPPYVEPEHRQIIEKAESALEEYSDFLIKKIKSDLFDNGFNLEPHPSDIRKAERLFHEDPVRLELIKYFVKIKAIYERQRFMVKAK